MFNISQRFKLVAEKVTLSDFFGLIARVSSYCVSIDSIQEVI